MQNKFRKMNTVKNSSVPLLTKEAKRALHIGMGMILASLGRLLYEVLRSAPFPAAVGERYGKMLEYPVAAMALLTALAFLLDRVVRAEAQKKRR